MANPSTPSNPFSASIIPFEVPEQMRALAEKGVSQARDSYAKFKDVAESHNGTIEAVFTSASKGASEYSAKMMEMKSQHHRDPGLCAGAVGHQVAFRGTRVVDFPRQEAVRGPYGAIQGARRTEPEGCDGNGRTDQGQCIETVQAGRLILLNAKKARA